VSRASLGYGLFGALLGLALAGLIGWMVLSRADNRSLPQDAGEFARSVDLTPLDRAAVHSEGRLKSFDSFAQETVSFISGPKRVGGMPPDFVYLDMLFRPEQYAQRPLIYVKNQSMRAQLSAALQGAGATDADWGRAFERDGLIEPALVEHPAAARLFRVWANDVVRTAKHVNAVANAIALSDPRALVSELKMIPPPGGGKDSAWIGLDQVWSAGMAFESPRSPADAIDPGLRAQIRTQVTNLAEAWRGENAEGASRSVAELARLLPQVAPDAYPSQTRLLLESWYHKSRHMTWVWLVYLLSLVLLLMSVAYKWDRARAMGIGVFVAALALHTGALGWRWYVSGRWPNSNMFEAVTTSVWFGAVLALVLDLWARRTAMRGLFALTGAAAAMAALMAAHFIPGGLNPSINNMMPILHDLWLYIHTNIIIASYALIAMAAVTGTLYIVRRIGGGSADYARAGGAGAVMNAATGEREKVSLGEVLDGATMTLMELSFVMLWCGIFMGAIWADHSWGRPWGWDPKEVFALNTFLVFLILVHVRLKARDKGLWTAVLAVIGCAVMLFNWIVINFVISGLHSYA